MLKILITTLLATVMAQAAPEGGHIKTEWASQVDAQLPLKEYPRPQMVRENWLNLNGQWDYAITSADAAYSKPDGKITVPFAVESALSGVERSVGADNALWYERNFQVPSSWKNKDVLLHIDAVDWKAEIWVNDIMVAEHTGGYTPIEVNVTPFLKKSGTQKLRVRVLDAVDKAFQPRGKQVTNPSGIWYTSVTGIWQTVWLEPVSQSHIENYYVVSDIDKKTLDVKTALAAEKAGDVTVVEILDGGIGYNPEKPSSVVVAKAEGTDVQIEIPDPQLWSPDSPYLYGVRISLVRDGKVIDKVEGYTSMRKISRMRDNEFEYFRLGLNNKILFQFGPLDQGWWPDGLYTAPTDEALRFDIEKTKEFGFNMIRKHIKVEPSRWYYWCDVLGMLVWQDMPSIAENNAWQNDTFFGGKDVNVPVQWKLNYYKEWSEIIAARKNFQCIVMWIPFNEGWGQFDTEAVVDFTRQQDPTRLINAASGGVLYMCGDVNDVHHYPWPAMRALDRKFINVLGEYGGIGYPISGHLWKESGDNWGYNGVKNSSREVLDQYAEFAEILKQLKKYSGCAAAIYTQTTDVEVEVNGLMTYDRVVKVDEKAMNQINSSVIEY